MDRATARAQTDVQDRIDRLAEELRVAGALGDPAWREALRAVPRHLFIPPRAWVHRDGQVMALDRERNPRAWWDAVYAADEAIVTQLDDGAPSADGGAAVPTSSSSGPRIQFEMFQLLDVADGMRVLEIGTGTGWNAALLAHRLGDANVTSVEVDPAVARNALRALEAAGRSPTVDTADGSHGYPPGAPYDRVIATCAVTRIPYAWIAQTRPGGLVLTPWTPPSEGGSFLARLVVGADGTASGRFAGRVNFMMLRQQRRAEGRPPPGLLDAAPAGTARSTTTLDAIPLLIRSTDVSFPFRLRLGEGSYGYVFVRDVPKAIVWLSDPASASWARIHTTAGFDPDAPADLTALPEGFHATVEQYGPRRLWDELQAVHDWWQQAGRPGLWRFGLTVAPDHHTIWLDDPTQPVFRLAAPATPTFLPATR